MQVTKGLIIADPWIGYVLDGSKTWEMRNKTQITSACCTAYVALSHFATVSDA
jgi:hypothetical protein